MVKSIPAPVTGKPGQRTPPPAAPSQKATGMNTDPLVYDSALGITAPRPESGFASTLWPSANGEGRGVHARSGKTVLRPLLGTMSQVFCPYTSTFRFGPCSQMDQITFWHPTPCKAISTQAFTASVTQLASPAPNLRNGAIETLIECLPDHKLLLCTQCKITLPNDDLEEGSFRTPHSNCPR